MEFEEIYTTYFSDVYMYIRGLSRDEHLAEEITSEERFFQKDAAMQIQKVLHDIPDPYKEVFMWRVFAEMSFKQIGQIFHKSENWACVTYHRARKMIKERLEADGYEK